MITRGTYADIQAYTQRVAQDDIDDSEALPSTPLLRGMSLILDTVCEEQHQNIDAPLDKAIEMRRAVEILTYGPRTCGGFKSEKGILGNLTPYEQMAALNTWMDRRGSEIRKPHTFAFLAPGGDQVVPIWVKKPKNSSATLFTTIIGSSRGKLKAPAYPTWATNDPKETDISHFVDPLLYLEAHRQPSYLASSFLRASSYDAGVISSDWRYKTANPDGTLAIEGSVEHKKQHTRKIEEIKQQSAGFNLCKMIQTNAEENLLPQANYEAYFEEGYDDDATPTVTPLEVCAAVSEYISDKPGPLNEIAAKLFATRLSSGSEIPIVQEFTRKALFKDK